VSVGRILFLQTRDSEKIPVGAVDGVDTTLSTQGEPADAKAVGDAIGNIASVLDSINGEVI
jgi:hypothetical protein